MLKFVRPSRFIQGRFFSVTPIEASKLSVEITQHPKTPLPKEELAFGATFSDHMLEIDWCSEAGWANPVIKPYGNLNLSPAASSLHYALQGFEGMKAYIDSEDNIRLFRPMMNMDRLNRTAKRLQLPAFDGEGVLACLKELLKIEKKWIPSGHGYSLYIRPTIISTHPYIGVAAPLSAKIFVILSPVGPYFPSGFSAVKLYADPQNVRAWPGGTGNVKAGGNYAMTIQPGSEAIKKGYSQVLWLFGEDLEVTEVGTMNQFFLWKTKEGKTELITAPLDGTILPGVTRDSILAMCREWNEFDIVERPYTLKEIMSACEEGRMIEAFGAGTACIVCPVKGFHYDGTDYEIPLDHDDPEAAAGKLTTRLANSIMDIQYGVTSHEWSEIVD